MYDVSITACKNYEQETVFRAMEAAVTPVGGLDWVKAGMKVLIKPNLVMGRRPETATATHPSLVCALTRMLVERGAEVWIADSPGGPFTGALLEYTYRVTGMKEAEKWGAHLNFVTTASLRKNPQAKVAGEMMVCDYLNGMDAVINVCKLKTHGMMGLSAAAKNLFGIVPGTAKPEYHFRYPDPMDFARMIVDLEGYVRPVLHICDAVVGMEGNGPTAGTPRELGLLLAARNPHMLDMVCADIIQCGEAPTLAAARERGLTPQSVKDISIFGQYQPQPDWKIVHSFTSTRFDALGRGPLAWAEKNILPILFAVRPQVRELECVKCQKCAQVCPAKAIEMDGKGGFPKVRREKCIGCFCCQEFCPKGAMKVKRTWIARILQKTK